jgi:hypothetical protein
LKKQDGNVGQSNYIVGEGDSGRTNFRKDKVEGTAFRFQPFFVWFLFRFFTLGIVLTLNRETFAVEFLAFEVFVL